MSTNIFLAGGDIVGIWNKLKRRRFKESEAKFVAACVLEAFTYLHTRGIIYRDLKPENVYLTPNGYFKLGDFGLAKQMDGNGRTFSFVGTNEYIAPEIILNKGHTRAVDYWTFGIFIHELLCGQTPFKDNSKTRIFTKILKGIDLVKYPTYFSIEAENIIRKLCRPLPAQRLGMQKSGISDINNHGWFQNFDFEALRNFEIRSPFKFQLKTSIDTSNIDEFKQPVRISPPNEMSGWDSEF